MGNHQKGGSSLRGMYVEVRNNDIGRAMRKLKKMVSNENIFQEVREKEAFEKPSLKRKKAKAAARKRWLKEQQKNAEK
tara:strand:- start:223 stop:456 length:234 start_codon:yes stop_codon:yes gene_type:complete